MTTKLKNLPYKMLATTLLTCVLSVSANARTCQEIRDDINRITTYGDKLSEMRPEFKKIHPFKLSPLTTRFSSNLDDFIAVLDDYKASGTNGTAPIRVNGRNVAVKTIEGILSHASSEDLDNNSSGTIKNVRGLKVKYSKGVIDIADGKIVLTLEKVGNEYVIKSMKTVGGSTTMFMGGRGLTSTAGSYGLNRFKLPTDLADKTLAVHNTHGLFNGTTMVSIFAKNGPQFGLALDRLVAFTEGYLFSYGARLTRSLSVTVRNATTQMTKLKGAGALLGVALATGVGFIISGHVEVTSHFKDVSPYVKREIESLYEIGDSSALRNKISTMASNPTDCNEVLPVLSKILFGK